MDKTAEEPLFGKTGSGQEDSFYDTIETSSPVEYDNAANTAQGVIQDPTERARQEEEWKTELAKLEEEIMTLRTVLSAKQYQASEIKRKLGITPMAEFRSDLKSGIQNIKGSDAVQKTNEKLTQITESIQSSDTYQKTNTAFKSLGAWSSKKMGDMRNSNAFKSFEERVGGAYTTVKTKVSGSKSENNFAEAVDQSEAPTSVENPIGNTEVEKPL